MGSPDIQVVWFKRDLRTRDHQSLAAAAERGPVLAVYIVEPELWRLPDMAAQHWEFIRESLLELRGALVELGGPLIVRTGEAVQVLDALRIELDDRVQTLWAHEETGNGWTYARDRDVLRWARTHRVRVNEMPRDGIVRRLRDRDEWGKLASAQFAGALLEPPPLPAVEPLIEAGHIPSLAHLQLAATASSGSHLMGQQAARSALDSFLQTRCIGYEKRLSSPLTAWEGCSRLSAHLTYGTISLREVMARTQRTASQKQPKRFSLKAFNERLHWRSHFIQKLEDQPSLEQQSYITEFDEIRLDPATNDVAAERFHAWSTGRTGYPMVDACMRSLNETGWINFRMRALLVSFASYDLWLDWRWTARHLAQAFIDYEASPVTGSVALHAGLAATWMMVGVIWFVQVVHYPLLAMVGVDRASEIAVEHQRRTGQVVGVPMAIEGVSTLVLLATRPAGVFWLWPWVAAVLLAVALGCTVLLSVPLHAQMASQPTPEVGHRLVRTNWPRTCAWTLRGLVLVVMAAQAWA